jgi:hypothetical protein
MSACAASYLASPRHGAISRSCRCGANLAMWFGLGSMSARLRGPSLSSSASSPRKRFARSRGATAILGCRTTVYGVDVPGTRRVLLRGKPSVFREKHMPAQSLQVRPRCPRCSAGFAHCSGAPRVPDPRGRTIPLNLYAARGRTPRHPLPAMDLRPLTVVSRLPSTVLCPPRAPRAPTRTQRAQESAGSSSTRAPGWSTAARAQPARRAAAVAPPTCAVRARARRTVRVRPAGKPTDAATSARRKAAARGFAA